MNVVICAINSQYVHSSLAPWCLASGLRVYAKEECCPVVIEGTVNEDLSVLVERILQAKPAILGFCCYIWNIERVYALAAILRKTIPQTPVIVGGPEVSYCPQEVLQRCSSIDYVLTGEGEYSFAALCSALQAGEEPVVPGLTKRTKQGIISFPEEPLAEPPSPYCDEYFEHLKGRIAYLETSRGCPYSCAYCLSARCGKLKFYPIQRAKDELLRLAVSGAKTIKLVDRTFNAHRKRARELFAFLIDNAGHTIPADVCFHFEIAGDLLDAETLDLLATAPPGLIQLEIGVQSFHEETLAYIRRKTDLTRLTDNIQKLLQAGNIHVHIDLIAGLPLEDFVTFQNSVNMAFALQPHMLQMGFLKMLPGSPMREQPERYPCAFNPTPPYEVKETPWLSAEELVRLHKVEWALDHLYNSGRFAHSLTYVLKQSGLMAFDLFLQFGMNVNILPGASLTQVAEAFYEFAKNLKDVNGALLRDIMVCDWLETVRGGRLPLFLQVQDPVLGQFRKALRANPGTAPKSGIARGVAVLYHPLRGIYADYTVPDPITRRYKLQEVPLTPES